MADVDPNGIQQHVRGAKLDAGKPDLSLLGLFPRALEQVGIVGTMGAEKYTRGGFREVVGGAIRYTAAMIRHWFKEDTEGTYDQDPWYDTPEGAKWKGKIRHDAQVAWNALARLELQLKDEESNEQS